MKGVVIFSSQDILFYSCNDKLKEKFRGIAQSRNKNALTEDGELDADFLLEFLMPLVHSQTALKTNIENSYRSVKAKNGMQFAFMLFDDNIYMAISDSSTESEMFLRRKLIALNRIVTCLFGPVLSELRGDSHTRVERWKSIGCLLNAWCDSYNSEQCFLVEEVEHLYVNSELIGLCKKRLDEAMKRMNSVDNLITHSFLLVQHKILASHSKYRSVTLEPSDILNLMIVTENLCSADLNSRQTVSSAAELNTKCSSNQALQCLNVHENGIVENGTKSHESHDDSISAGDGLCSKQISQENNVIRSDQKIQIEAEIHPEVYLPAVNVPSGSNGSTSPVLGDNECKSNLVSPECMMQSDLPVNTSNGAKDESILDVNIVENISTENKASNDSLVANTSSSDLDNPVIKSSSSNLSNQISPEIKKDIQSGKFVMRKSPVPYDPQVSVKENIRPGSGVISPRIEIDNMNSSMLKSTISRRTQQPSELRNTSLNISRSLDRKEISNTDPAIEDWIFLDDVRLEFGRQVMFLQQHIDDRSRSKQKKMYAVPHMVECVQIVNDIKLILISQVSSVSDFESLLLILDYCNRLLSRLGDPTDTFSNLFSRIESCVKKLCVSNSVARYCEPLRKACEELKPILHNRKENLLQNRRGSTEQSSIDHLERTVSAVQNSVMNLLKFLFLQQRAKSGEVDTCSAYKTQVDNIRRNLYLSLNDYQKFLSTVTKNGIPFSSATYPQMFSGLVHFIFVDRHDGYVIAPSLNVESGDVEIIRKNQNLCTQLWQLMEIMQANLSQGYTSTAQLYGDYYCTYSLWFEDNEGNKISADITPVTSKLTQQYGRGVAHYDFYKKLVEQCFPISSSKVRDVHCYEMLCLHNPRLATSAQLSHRCMRVSQEIRKLVLQFNPRVEA